ncbi:hypothetical protein, partial [Streptomyces sp. AF1A]|uniref:hypothetical protein n=1 Tax=Streptomyces sp. AF1A TaxID=3394350 RepID=UPI0039BD22CF
FVDHYGPLAPPDRRHTVTGAEPCRSARGRAVPERAAAVTGGDGAPGWAGSMSWSSAPSPPARRRPARWVR